MKCGSCKEELFREDAILCSECSISYHPNCVNIREEKFRKLPPASKSTWKCPTCTQKRSTLLLNKNQDQNKNLPNPEDKTSIAHFMSDINQKLDSIKEENKKQQSELQIQLQEVIKSLDFNSESVNELTQKNQTLSKEILDLKETLQSTIKENAVLKGRVDELTMEIVELQQYSRRTNVEISEVPEIDNENVEELTESIIKALDLQKSDIVTAHRIPTRNPTRKKPIIVQFKTKAAKDACVKSAKIKKIKASQINTSFPDTSVYVNDHLCPAMKSLFFEARKFKKNNNYKFCWTRDAKIFLRKNESSKAIRIRKLSDIPNE